MYKVELDAFEGPLDLLLYLIRKSEIDIYDIRIAEITEQYIQYIDLMKMLDLDIAGEFLVMATTLLQMKSETMLPSGVTAEYDEPGMTREELVRQLLEYRTFKNAATMLSQQEKMRQNLYPRSFSEPGLESLDLKRFKFEATMFDLLSAFSTILKVMPEEQLTALREETITVQERMREILVLLKDRKRIEFGALFPTSSRLEIIVTFLAILELIRTRRIIARQTRLFGSIWMYRARVAEQRAKSME